MIRHTHASSRSRRSSADFKALGLHLDINCSIRTLGGVTEPDNSPVGRLGERRAVSIASSATSAPVSRTNLFRNSKLAFNYGTAIAASVQRSLLIYISVALLQHCSLFLRSMATGGCGVNVNVVQAVTYPRWGNTFRCATCSASGTIQATLQHS